MDSKGYFDDVAGNWDQMRSEFFSTRVRDRAYQVAALEPDKLAADLGAGTGFLTEGLLGRCRGVIAVDQSDAMLTELRRKLDAPNLECRSGDAHALPLRDAEVDYAFANMYLHHVEDPPRAIREMYRVLRPGGRLVITDLDAHDFEWLRTEHHDRWLGFQRGDIRKWFEAAGFRDVAIDCVGECCSAESGAGDGKSSVNIFYACGQK